MLIRKNYLAIEGLDGAGKSTIIDRLRTRLAKCNVSALTYHDPIKHDPLSKFVMKAWQNREKSGEEILHLLFAASSLRSQQLAIADAIERDISWVISDRCPFSTFAYLSSIEFNHFIAVHDNYQFPSIAVFLEIEPELASSRQIGRGTPKDEAETFLKGAESIAKRYHALGQMAREYGIIFDCVEISEKTSPEDVVEHIVALINAGT